MDVYNQVNEKVNAKCLIRFCFLYETKALYCSTLRLTEIKKTTVPRGGGGYMENWCSIFGGGVQGFQRWQL